MVYAIMLTWPDDSVLVLGAPIPSQSTQVTMLGYEGTVNWIAGPGGQGMNITLQNIPWNKLPSPWAWMFKLTNIAN